MLSTLATLLDRLDSPAMSATRVIQWGCPVPSFGDLSLAQVATVGINPSNLEFMDEAGNELQGAERRFHTLMSLGLDSWGEADARHLETIAHSCRAYFDRNPYDRWFKRLDAVLAGINASYYDSLLHASGLELRACHLDLFPYATACKWTELSGNERLSLLKLAGDTLGHLLRDSPLRLVILNGQSVVRHFEQITGVALSRQEMTSWSLPRRSSQGVIGIAYTGTIDELAGVGLGHRLVVLGFNHNIQSSFGVTSEVLDHIRDWMALAVRRMIR
jgi:hypothetical protein